MIKIEKEVKAVRNIVITTLAVTLLGKKLIHKKTVRSKYAADFPCWTIILLFLIFSLFLFVMMPEYRNSTNGLVAFIILISAATFTLGYGMNKMLS